MMFSCAKVQKVSFANNADFSIFYENIPFVDIKEN